jgi:monofunctional glycosyltransferase
MGMEDRNRGPVAGPTPDPPPGQRRGRRSRRALLIAALLPVAYYLLCVVGLAYLRFLPPLTTGVQVQRAVERVVAGERPVLVYRWRSSDRISRHLPRAVVAAEDARFYRHRGFDWEELRRARERAEARGEAMRGASTLTQQLIKNLYFTTHRNPVRKAYEWALTPPAEWILGKDRILELYVNVVEFGPGIYGAEAAARHHYGIGAGDLTRHQAASLAAVLPAPLQRRPQAMGWYTGIIQQRMSQLGW